MGKFSDPKLHAGGLRDIRLLADKKLGDFQFAEVHGGGGVGEPKSYVLPAVILGDRSIIVDFSTLGGPKDASGVLDKKGYLISPRTRSDGIAWVVSAKLKMENVCSTTTR